MKLYVSADWGSRNFGHRSSIRSAIYERSGESSVLDLEFPPRLSRGFVSISHSPSFGGFLFGPSPLGLDIEDREQIRPNVVARLADWEEFVLAPTAGHLWTAKEAIFKTLLGVRQPKTLAPVRVGWLDERFFVCENFQSFGLRDQGLGRVWEAANSLMAVFALEWPTAGVDFKMAVPCTSEYKTC